MYQTSEEFSLKSSMKSSMCVNVLECWLAEELDELQLWSHKVYDLVEVGLQDTIEEPSFSEHLEFKTIH